MEMVEWRSKRVEECSLDETKVPRCVSPEGRPGMSD